MSKGGGEAAPQTVTNDPWSAAQPYMKDIFAKGSAILESPSGSPYPYAQTAGISPEMETGLQMQTQRAMQGSPVGLEAQNLAQDTLSGQFLGSNPYLDDMYGRMSQNIGQQYQDITAPAIASQMGLAGRTGSGAHQQALERSQNALGGQLGDLAANVYGGDYARERQNQMATMGMSPQMANMDYQDIGMLRDVGSARQGYKQQEINDAMNQYGQGQAAPMDKLQQFSALMGGGGQGGTQTQSGGMTGGNTMGGMLGGAATGAGIASAVGATNPWTLGLSALGGGLLSR